MHAGYLKILHENSHDDIEQDELSCNHEDHKVNCGNERQKVVLLSIRV